MLLSRLSSICGIVLVSTGILGMMWGEDGAVDPPQGFRALSEVELAEVIGGAAPGQCAIMGGGCTEIECDDCAGQCYREQFANCFQGCVGTEGSCEGTNPGPSCRFFYDCFTYCADCRVQYSGNCQRGCVNL
jgi:hypothetical protein